MNSATINEFKQEMMIVTPLTIGVNYLMGTWYLGAVPSIAIQFALAWFVIGLAIMLMYFAALVLYPENKTNWNVMAMVFALSGHAIWACLWFEIPSSEGLKFTGVYMLAIFPLRALVSFGQYKWKQRKG